MKIISIVAITLGVVSGLALISGVTLLILNSRHKNDKSLLKYKPQSKRNLKVNYNNENGHFQVVLKPEDTQQAPHVTYDANDSELYTLVMVDPDAPSRKNPTLAEWRHWVVINIPGQDVSKGNTVSEYMGPAPPEGTGYHRYVFLLYKQPSRITMEHMNDNQRSNFDADQFAKSYNLGKPIDMYHFLSKSDKNEKKGRFSLIIDNGRPEWLKVDSTTNDFKIVLDENDASRFDIMDVSRPYLTDENNQVIRTLVDERTNERVPLVVIPIDPVLGKVTLMGRSRHNKKLRYIKIARKSPYHVDFEFTNNKEEAIKLHLKEWSVYVNDYEEVWFDLTKGHIASKSKRGCTSCGNDRRHRELSSPWRREINGFWSRSWPWYSKWWNRWDLWDDNFMFY